MAVTLFCLSKIIKIYFSEMDAEYLKNNILGALSEAVVMRKTKNNSFDEYKPVYFSFFLGFYGY